ncbi:MAG: sugar phosphate isomerase/epimerase family protein [Sulfurifustis sp.]
MKVVELPPFMTGFGVQQYHRAEDGIVRAAEEGCTHWYIDGASFADRAAAWNKLRFENMRSLIDRYNVKPIYHGSFKIPLSSDVPELRDISVQYVLREVDVAAELSAPLIVHGGGIVEPREVSQAKERALEGLIASIRTIANYAEDKGVPIWLENLSNYMKFHPFYYIYTHMPEYERVLSEVDNIWMLLDVCHDSVGGGDPTETFVKFNKRVAAFSFSDTEGGRDSHLPLGLGRIDFKRLVKHILALDWKGVVAFETRGIDVTKNVEYLNRLVLDLNTPTADIA